MPAKLEDLASAEQLLARSREIAGLTFSQLATKLSLIIPEEPARRKGFIGMAIELALGTTAGNTSQPDFHHLGIELKTLPINHLCKPAESTFITSIPLLTVHKQTWRSSQCYSKLKQVLWVPIEGDEKIPYIHRRLGEAILWSPSSSQEKILANDWEEHTFLIRTGQLHKINATQGEYLQVRPKAANSKSLCDALDEDGNKIKTMPRGFYLRSAFTASILS